jgi:hypothetical protein
MVLALGYNRLSTMTSDTEEERQRKILRFWMIYMMDTSFSVSLGRSPIIREHEIAVPELFHSALIPDGFIDMFRFWTELGRVQCQAAERLYSPQALRQPMSERAEVAASLAAKLDRAWTACQRVRIERVCSYDSPVYLLMIWAPQTLVDTPRCYETSMFYFLIRETNAIMYHGTM